MSAYRENALPVGRNVVTFRQRVHTGDLRQPRLYPVIAYGFATPEEAATFVLGLKMIQEWNPDPKVEWNDENELQSR